MVTRLSMVLVTLGVVQAQNLQLSYESPAEDWADAVPIGNGRMGAMLYGGVDVERLQIAEDTLWSGGPRSYDNPDAFQHLTNVRGLLREGKYGDAELLAEKMMGKPVYQASHQPLADLLIESKYQEKATEYSRELDLEKAEASVSYKIGDITYKRTVFASHPDDAIVLQFDCSEAGKLTFDLSFSSLHPVLLSEQSSHGMIAQGQVAPRLKKMGNGSRALISLWDQPGTKFAAQMKVLNTGGKVEYIDGKLSVKEADSVTVLVSTATSFVNYKDVSADPVEKIKQCFAGLDQTNFKSLRERHQVDYQKLFKRVSLKLGDTSAAEKSTLKLLEQAKGGDLSNPMSELLFQYGRYLMIAGSRPGSQPLNLQGKWNFELSPRWGSKYTININTEMNYWVAEVCNLSECHEPLFKMIDELQETGKKTAQTHYKARGWMVHHNTDLWRGSSPVDGAHWGMWPMGGAWLCQHIWEHYLYSKDEEFLKKSYPAMKGLVQFYLDVLVKDQEGYYLTSPSLSPEHSHGGGSKDGLSNDRSGASLCEGPMIDIMLLNDLFANYIKASKVLEMDEELRSEVVAVRAKLTPLKVGRHGQLQEWQKDWDNPSVPHSHVSHLYGLFPSAQINKQDTPKLAKAAMTSLTHRGFSQGWSGAWRGALWARLNHGENSMKALQKTVAGFGTNLFNYGLKFQIDANFGVTAAMTEMLLQSHLTSDEGVTKIELLPALPKAWPEGSLSGIKARGGFVVDFSWKDGKVSDYKITSTKDSDLILILGGKEHHHSLKVGEVLRETLSE